MPKLIEIQDDIELWDERSQKFHYVKSCKFEIEHSLESLSKWEQKYHLPFMSYDKKTTDHVRHYIRCMNLTEGIPPDTFDYLPSKIIDEITEYINDPMSANTLRPDPPKGIGRPTITAETIYYKMLIHNIPFECSKWHLNRLLALIDYCDVKSEPPKKMSKQEVLRKFYETNEARLAKTGSKG